MPIPWVLQLVNSFASDPRAAAGEEHTPYPPPPEPARSAGLTVPDLVGLADRIWPVFGAATDHDRAAALNALLDGATLAPRIHPDGSVGWTGPAVGPAAALPARCALALFDAVREHGWSRLGVCAGEDCVDVHLAASARGGRRYCSATCLNRARVRAYRARQRDAP